MTLSEKQEILAQLARAKAAFQQRTIVAVINEKGTQK